jgi:hypothetical protein
MKNAPRATEMDVDFNLLLSWCAVASNVGSHNNAQSDSTHGPRHEVGEIGLAVDVGNIYP